ncbi:glycoside hydrolase family 36 protein [Viridibacillus sp. FSL E2-0187]|uniref:glycoside hydrolase family 36 protein n=1 Tax=Viridibacillus sp. FSL E2-0187 TaxID=2921362 RepID=UPI0030FC911C
MLTQQNIKIEAVCDPIVDVKLEEYKINDITYVNVQIDAKEFIHFPKVDLIWHYPIIDIQSYWHPGSGRSKSFGVDWDGGFSSKGTVSAPVGCFYSQDGKNRLSVAYSKVMETVGFNLGVHEENGTIKCHITLFTEQTKKMKQYHATIRIDTRDIPYYEAIEEISKWYETIENNKPSIVPEESKLPMYCTWYSFHQNVTDHAIEEQSRHAKQFGCEAVIVDDGWQTEDNQRGYAYCGDWEVAASKIPNMKEHVEKVHAMGMKYLLWYSVPFVGKHAKVWDQFRNKILYFQESLQAGVLDPRYPEVREYLISVYETALKEWNIDGFKFDFIDNFDVRRANEKALEPDENRDFESVQEAVDRLLTDVMERLRVIKPSIMIEFRQRYIGPHMRKYGNIFRVMDCPNDAITNRVGVIDLRLFSGSTAVHSDPIMWNKKDTVESAALQLINVLFGVPQFSMRFENLSHSHLEMAKYWLGFWKEHRDVLLNGKLKAEAPELLYPIVSAENDVTKIIAVYGDVVVKSGKSSVSNLIIVNGTLKEELVLDLEEDIMDHTLEIYDCCGHLVKKQFLSLHAGLNRLHVQKSGILMIKKG